MEQFIEPRISEPEKLIKADSCSAELGVGLVGSLQRVPLSKGLFFTPQTEHAVQLLSLLSQGSGGCDFEVSFTK